MRTGNIERLLQLCALLMSREHAHTARQIREEIPYYRRCKTATAFRKQLQRDIRTLREIGVPVEVDAETYEYSVRPKRYHHPIVEFTADELNCICLATKAVARAFPGFRAEAEAALRKIQFGAWQEARAAEQHGAHVDLRPVAPSGGLEEEDLRTAAQAVLRRWRLRLDYQALDETKPVERLVSAYGLAAFQGQWYLVGYCHERRAVRTFKCARIRALRLHSSSPDDPEFEMPPDFSLRDHVGLEYWQLPSERGPTDVLVRFSPEISWWARRRFGSFASSLMETDAGLTMTISAANPDALVDMLLSEAHRAEVLGPPGARRRAVQALRQIAGEHQET